MPSGGLKANTYYLILSIRIDRHFDHDKINGMAQEKYNFMTRILSDTISHSRVIFAVLIFTKIVEV